ncbi:MAG: hypothetical protein KJZ86_25450 [Caldilineaceae bacterium]|nr:hypothetical protein [Caldilineaceae bacterium]
MLFLPLLAYALALRLAGLGLIVLSPAEEAALEWFRAVIPERTLYNWQKDAAGLVAQDLWEREGMNGSRTGAGTR